MFRSGGHLSDVHTVASYITDFARQFFGNGHSIGFRQLQYIAHAAAANFHCISIKYLM